MNRPSFEQVYIDLAKSLARRSTCARLKVGAVITTTDYRKVLAIGYNGNAAGLPNKCDSEEPGKCGCLHAEENASIFCDAPRGQEKVVFVTHLPCGMCAKRLVNLGGVTRVVIGDTYRSDDGVGIFKRSGIEIGRYIHDGHIERLSKENT